MKLLIGAVVLGLLFSCQKEERKDSSSEKNIKIFNNNLGTMPATLNPFTSKDNYATQVHSLVFETLLEHDIETYEYKPSLAKEWSISEDGMTFEYIMREDAKWHDGKPVTPEDVKFTFDAIMDKENRFDTAHRKLYFSNIESVEVEGQKVIAKVKEKYFQNFSVFSSLKVLPKHIYNVTGKKETKKFNKWVLGSGKYIFDEYKKGKHITFKKNKNHWDKTPGEYNFDKIVLKFYKEPETELQRFIKGDIDFFGMDAEQFVKKSSGGKWESELKKYKVENKVPKGYSFIGLNQKFPVFKDRDVRKALALLINRDLMNDKFEHGMALKANGPVYRQSDYNNPNVKPVGFDPKKALEILRSKGWSDTDKNGILDKIIDGKKTELSFTILEPRKDFQKYLTIFKEDAKQVGVDVNIKLIEWNSFVKLINERKFEALRIAWTATIDWDPKQIWHSSSIANQGTNFINYRNDKVDKLIDEARLIMDKKERTKKLHRVHELIANDYPYLFFFNQKYGFYAHQENIKKKKDTYKYGIGYYQYWIKE